MPPSNSSLPTPREMAERLVAEAPNPSWLRALVDDLDRRVRIEPLEQLIRLWDLSASEAASMFGVSRQAFSKWRRHGPPPERTTAVAALSAATNLLASHVKRERIPAVVRRAASQLDGKSLYEMAAEGRHEEVRDAVEFMFDLRRVQP